MNTIRFVLHHAKPDHKKILGIVCFVFVYAFGMLLAPLIVSFIVDKVINGDVMGSMETALVSFVGGIEVLREHIWMGGILIILVYGIVAFAIHKRSMYAGMISERFAMNVRDAMYDHMQKLPFSYHKMKDSGDLIQRSTSDIEQVRRFLGGQMAEMMFAIFTISVAGVILYSIHPTLMFIAISFMPLLIVISFFFFMKSKKIFLSCDEAEADMTGILQENLNAMRVVKAFQQEKREMDKFEVANDLFREKLYQLMHAMSVFWGGTDVLCMFQILLVIVCGIHYADIQELTAGNFFVFLTYEGMMIWPMRQLGRILADMGKVVVSSKRMQEVLQEKMEDLTTGLTPNIKGDIVFDHVSFHYDDAPNLVLKDVSFMINAGSRIAIMGPTGSGKSSLMHILTRIYEYEGSIKIDGIELRDISKTWLRDHIAIVLQEPFLFSKSIYDNIALAKASASRKEVEKVANIASIHHDILQFEDGYDTAVGEKGVTLSGGQKQRIAIARTIIKETPIVIFDDSLSALDAKTDSQIQQALATLNTGLTSIMITHRINSAANADQIIVLEAGSITQMGTHAQLIEKDGLYKKIYEIQKEGGMPHVNHA